MSMHLVGSRGSRLALRQTGEVVERLALLDPDLSCRIQVIRTTGDRMRGVPLAGVGGKGLFVREIEQALVRGQIDFAVHSAKDLPSEMDEALCIAAYPPRANPADALVSRAGSLAEMPAGSVIGTSSIRRRSQLLHARPDLRFADLRGNLDTRLRKLDEGRCDAAVLACAGLLRMGWESRITEVLPYEVCLPAAGQGALAVQCRKGDPVAESLRRLDHGPTRDCVCAERAFLARLGAGCQTPVAALAREEDGRIAMDALVASVDGSGLVRESGSGEACDPEGLGNALAEKLLDSPARGFLEEARRIAGPTGMGAA